MNLFSETKNQSKNFDYNQSFDNENFKSNNPNSSYREPQNLNDSTGDIRKFRNYEICSLDSLLDYLAVNNLDSIELDDINYTNVRAYEFFNFYGLLKEYSNSSWSIIKGLFFNLLSFCFCVNVNFLDESLILIVQNDVAPLLQELLEAKEGECQISGLNLLGSFCGLGYDIDGYEKSLINCIEIFRRNSSHIPITIWERIFKLQENWDITIQIASITV